jgi:L-ascorbate metabolism protein UlaG (beta-lactamase superfamily)
MLTITWLGHSTFTFQLPSGEVILTDPWLENPKFPAGRTLDRVDAILITHGHFDHTADAAAVAKKCNAPVVAIYEIATWLSQQGVADARGMNKGGTQQVGPVSVTMTHALHSSSLADGTYGGEAAGYVLTLPDERRIYFAGDTAVFSDMALIRELYAPQLAILPVGDLYTMGPREAAVACRLLQPAQVIGMHWGTFPPLTGTPAKLAELLASSGLPTQVLPLQPGEFIQW